MSSVIAQFVKQPGIGILHHFAEIGYDPFQFNLINERGRPNSV